MKISIGIIARNEEARIAATIASLAGQDLFERFSEVEVIVVANGCTDDTVSIADAALREQFAGRDVDARVHETALPGKSRSWNLYIHELARKDADRHVLIDADIAFVDQSVLSAMFDCLDAHPVARVCSGRPEKRIAIKRDKSLIDWFSLRASAHTAYENGICGQLYVGLATELRKIWLPQPTPGEDGFLNAMIHTNGFCEAAVLDRVCQLPAITHYYDSTSVAGYFRHERRMAVGTTVNIWIFEYLMAKSSKSHVGALIRDNNLTDPGWVQTIIADRVGDRRWAVPTRLLTWRMDRLRGSGAQQVLVRLPFALVATALNVIPCLMANRVLKRRDAATIW